MARHQLSHYGGPDGGSFLGSHAGCTSVEALKRNRMDVVDEKRDAPIPPKKKSRRRERSGTEVRTGTTSGLGPAGGDATPEAAADAEG